MAQAGLGSSVHAAAQAALFGGASQTKSKDTPLPTHPSLLAAAEKAKAQSAAGPPGRNSAPEVKARAFQYDPTAPAAPMTARHMALAMSGRPAQAGVTGEVADPVAAKAAEMQVASMTNSRDTAPRDAAAAAVAAAMPGAQRLLQQATA